MTPNLDMFSLEGKTALVTGANTGLGQGICVAYAKAGANVIGVARRSCEDTAAKIADNAGIIKRCDAADVSIEDWDSVININEKMVFFLSQAFAKGWLSDHKGGKIINIASMLSYQGGIRVPAYTASKSAIIGLTRELANEWSKHNINVNAIAPGYMETNNTENLRKDEQRSEEILGRIPAGRWGTPEDIAGLYLKMTAVS